MSEGYIGEIRMFGGNYTPQGWSLCDGTMININQNQALFSLLGTTYGGDGKLTFALPDLRGRLPIHMGAAASGTRYSLGENGGAETVTLTSPHMPSHTHPAFYAKKAGDLSSPDKAVWAGPGTTLQYAPTATLSMASGTVASSGQDQPHDDMMPYQAVSFIICLTGFFPPRS